MYSRTDEDEQGGDAGYHVAGIKFADLEERGFRDLDAVDLPQDPEDQEDQRGSRAKCARDEARSQQCGVPEGAGF